MLIAKKKILSLMSNFSIRLFILVFKNLSIKICLIVSGGTVCHSPCLRKSGDSLEESVHSFHHVGSGD